MRVRVSRLVLLWWRDGQLICDDPVRQRQMALTAGAERMLRPFADWADISSADDVQPDGEVLAGQLLAAHILIAEGSAEHQRERQLGAWRALGMPATYFHLATRTHAGTQFRTAAQDRRVLRDKASATPPPPPTKVYPESRLRSSTVDLERVALPTVDFARVLTGRRSTREFDPGRPVARRDLAALLDYTAGVRHEVPVEGLGRTLLKTAPSGGARHPIEVYPVVRRVDGLDAGIYHYAPDRHALVPIARGPVSDEDVLSWCAGQPHAAAAGCLLLYTAIPGRTAWKYPAARAYRALLLDLGHLSQTVYLVATALGLGAFFTAATRDAPAEAALGLDWAQEILLGVTGLGVPTTAERERQERMREGGPAGFSIPHDAWHGFP